MENVVPYISNKIQIQSQTAWLASEVNKTSYTQSEWGTCVKPFNAPTKFFEKRNRPQPDKMPG